MEASISGISPLRQRMIDDMRMRKLNPKTQTGYIHAVRNFTQYLGRSPDTATVEDLRRYQLHLVDAGTSPMSVNAAITGLKFFFDITLPLVDDQFVALVPVNHPLATRKAVSLADLCNSPFAMTTAGSTSQIEQLFASAGLHPTIKHRYSQVISIVKMVEREEGVSIVADRPCRIR